MKYCLSNELNGEILAKWQLQLGTLAGPILEFLS